MDAAHIRIKLVRAAAATAALLSLSAPIVHAGPGDGAGSSDNTDPPPGQVLVEPAIDAYASENPVVFLPHQNYRTIQALWTSQPVSEVVVKVQDNSGEIVWQGLDHGSASSTSASPTGTSTTCGSAGGRTTTHALRSSSPRCVRNSACRRW